MLKSSRDWLRLGEVGRPHGLKGAFFVSRRDEPWPRAMKRVSIGADAASGKCYGVDRAEYRHGRVILICGEIANRDAAEALRGQSIWGEREALEIDASDEFLWQDLVGLLVIDVNGVNMGHLIDIYNVGASDIAVIRSTEGRKVELPLVQTYFDLGFVHVPDHLRLHIEAGMIDELWYEA